MTYYNTAALLGGNFQILQNNEPRLGVVSAAIPYGYYTSNSRYGNKRPIEGGGAFYNTAALEGGGEFYNTAALEGGGEFYNTAALEGGGEFYNTAALEGGFAMVKLPLMSRVIDWKSAKKLIEQKGREILVTLQSNTSQSQFNKLYKPPKSKPNLDIGYQQMVIAAGIAYLADILKAKIAIKQRQPKKDDWDKKELRIMKYNSATLARYVRKLSPTTQMLIHRILRIVRNPVRRKRINISSRVAKGLRNRNQYGSSKGVGNYLKYLYKGISPFKAYSNPLPDEPSYNVRKRGRRGVIVTDYVPPPESEPEPEQE